MKTLLNKLKNQFFLLCLIFLTACSTQSNNTPSTNLIKNLFDEKGGVMVTAHRACWHDAPENSLKAISDCIDMGVDIIELDVRLSADGELVLMHDATLDRTTNGKGPVSSFTLLELKQLKLKQLKLKQSEGGTKQLTDQAIPTYKEALLAIKGKVLINVDAKNAVFSKAVSIARSLNMQKHIIIKMELPQQEEQLRSFDFMDQIIFMPKVTEGQAVLSKFASKYSIYNPVAFEVKARTEEYLVEGANEIMQTGARLWVNTMSESPHKSANHIDRLAIRDPDAHWGRLIALGVNIFQTDEPQHLLNYLTRKGLR